MTYKEWYEDARFGEESKKERIESYQKAIKDLEIKVQLRGDRKRVL
jgi:hypothetical protein